MDVPKTQKNQQNKTHICIKETRTFPHQTKYKKDPNTTRSTHQQKYRIYKLGGTRHTHSYPPFPSVCRKVPHWIAKPHFPFEHQRYTVEDTNVKIPKPPFFAFQTMTSKPPVHRPTADRSLVTFSPEPGLIVTLESADPDAALRFFPPFRPPPRHGNDGRLLSSLFFFNHSLVPAAFRSCPLGADFPFSFFYSWFSTGPPFPPGRSLLNPFQTFHFCFSHLSPSIRHLCQTGRSVRHRLAVPSSPPLFFSLRTPMYFFVLSWVFQLVPDSVSPDTPSLLGPYGAFFFFLSFPFVLSRGNFVHSAEVISITLISSGLLLFFNAFALAVSLSPPR